MSETKRPYGVKLSPRTAPYWARRACPFCGADLYERCTRPNGQPTLAHNERTRSEYA
jgi:hypothetical protein